MTRHDSVRLVGLHAQELAREPSEQARESLYVDIKHRILSRWKITALEKITGLNCCCCLLLLFADGCEINAHGLRLRQKVVAGAADHLPTREAI